MRDLENRAKYLKKIIDGKAGKPMEQYKEQAIKDLKKIENMKGYPWR